MMSISLVLNRTPEEEGINARKLIIPKGKVQDFISNNKAFFDNVTILSGSTVSSLYYQPSNSTQGTHKATAPIHKAASLGAEPTVIIVSVRLQAFKGTRLVQFAPNTELDTACLLFNNRLFPKQADGRRKSVTWQGKGLCHVSDGTVQKYGLGIVWKRPQTSQASPATSRRASTVSDTSPPDPTASRRASASSELSADLRRVSSTTGTSMASSPASSRRSSVSSVRSNASASSLALRPPKLSQVTFSVKRFGLLRDFQVGCCERCDPNGESFICPKCRLVVAYRGDLAFQVTAHDARGQMLALKPLVAEQALDDAFDTGLDAMLASHRLDVEASFDLRGRIKIIKPETCKWASTQ